MEEVMNVIRMPQTKAKGVRGRHEARSGAWTEGGHETQRIRVSKGGISI